MNFNFKKIFWSIVLIAAGVIILGNNAGWFYLSWDDIVPFIYVGLIILGISILPIKDSIKLISSGLALLAALFVFIFAEPRNDRSSLKHIFGNSDWIYDNDDQDDDDDIWDDNDIWEDNDILDDSDILDDNDILNDDGILDDDKDDNSQRYSRHGRKNLPQAMISYAHETEVDFDITASAGTYSIGSSKESGNLVNLNQSGPTCAYSLTSEDIGQDRKKINFSISGAINNIDKSKIDSTKYNLQLNSHPVWNFDIESGAASINIDGRDIKIKNIDIEQGVASTNIIVGNMYPDVNISVSSGVSTLKIKIPEDAYCKINNEGALNLKNLKGFSNKGDGKYIYNEKSANPSCRININLETALSTLNVETY